MVVSCKNCTLHLNVISKGSAILAVAIAKLKGEETEVTFTAVLPKRFDALPPCDDHKQV